MSERKYSLNDTARDLMHEIEVQVVKGTPVIEVLELMDEKNADFAVITKSDGQISGVYSLTNEIDVLNYPDQGQALLDAIIDDVMINTPVVVSPNDSCEYIARVLRDRHIHRVVVVERLNPIGIVDQKSINRWFVRANKTKDDAT